MKRMRDWSLIYSYLIQGGPHEFILLASVQVTVGVPQDSLVWADSLKSTVVLNKYLEMSTLNLQLVQNWGESEQLDDIPGFKKIYIV